MALWFGSFLKNFFPSKSFHKKINFRFSNYMQFNFKSNMSINCRISCIWCKKWFNNMIINFLYVIFARGRAAFIFLQLCWNICILYKRYIFKAFKTAFVYHSRRGPIVNITHKTDLTSLSIINVIFLFIVELRLTI